MTGTSIYVSDALVTGSSVVLAGTVGMLKVSKSQKQIILFSFLPKNEQKTFILVARILG